MAPSYRGLVRRPLTAVTRVRIPLGSPSHPRTPETPKHGEERLRGCTHLTPNGWLFGWFYFRRSGRSSKVPIGWVFSGSSWNLLRVKRRHVRFRGGSSNPRTSPCVKIASQSSRNSTASTTSERSYRGSKTPALETSHSKSTAIRCAHSPPDVYGCFSRCGGAIDHGRRQ